MSLATWKSEFYPTDARECPARQAIAHSLTKWIGLRREARARHAVLVNAAGHLVDEGTSAAPRFSVNATSCALCERFFNDDNEDEPCASCPLAKARGGVPCDRTAARDEHISPWGAWSDLQNPEPMIAALEAAKKLAEEEMREVSA